MGVPDREGNPDLLIQKLYLYGLMRPREFGVGYVSVRYLSDFIQHLYFGFNRYLFKANFSLCWRAGHHFSRPVDDLFSHI